MTERYGAGVLEPGDKAPDFTLLDQHGERFTLSKSLKQRKARHVIYFYPKADTPGCTTQSCALRDARPALDDLDAVVVGISPDPPAKQQRFDTKHDLGFPLLADEDHGVAERYGVWGEKSLYGKRYMGIVRSAFVVGTNVKVIAAFYKVSPKATVPKVTAALEV